MHGLGKQNLRVLHISWVYAHRCVPMRSAWVRDAQHVVWFMREHRLDTADPVVGSVSWPSILACKRPQGPKFPSSPCVYTAPPMYLRLCKPWRSCNLLFSCAEQSQSRKLRIPHLKTCLDALRCAERFYRVNDVGIIRTWRSRFPLITDKLPRVTAGIVWEQISQSMQTQVSFHHRVWRLPEACLSLHHATTQTRLTKISVSLPIFRILHESMVILYWKYTTLYCIASS